MKETEMPDGAAPSMSPAEAGPHQTADTPKGLRSLLSRIRGQKDQGLNGVIQNGAVNGSDLSSAEREMIERILAFDKQRVEDVAIPRADIVGVDHEVVLTELVKCFSEANHSRLPVYRGDLDDPIGMVHIKDVIGLLAEPESRAAKSDQPILQGLVRKILYVPPSMPVTDLLLRMQASRVHMALVIDEFGGTDGLVTIEDLIELIVGDIRDEHDEGEDFTIEELGEGRWRVDARTPLEDLHDRIGIDFRLEDHEADTVGGLVFSLAGRVPLRGEIISHPNGNEFDIREADPRRVRKVLIRAGSRKEPGSPPHLVTGPDPAPPSPVPAKIDS